MAFIRVKTRGGRRYAYLVESIWRPDLGSPRQRVIRYLGPEDSVRDEDVPEEHRHDPAVARWLRARSPPVPEANARALAPLRRELREALLGARRNEAELLAREAIAKLGLRAFVEDVARPLLVEIGEDWYAGRIGVADEHVVTRGISEAVRRVRDESLAAAPVARAGRLSVLLANPEGEDHNLALGLLEARLLQAGHHVIVCVGGTPRRELARRAREVGAELVLLSATLATNAPEALRAARDVLAAWPQALVVLGGQAWSAMPTMRDSDPRIRILPQARLESVDGLASDALARRAAIAAGRAP